MKKCEHIQKGSKNEVTKMITNKRKKDEKCGYAN